MITVQGLTRRFGPVTAVDDLSFHLEKGEVVGFLGPNGAGKTTAMRILTGYLPATSGSVSVAGLDVLRQSLEVRRRLGYLPESVPLYGEHRVSEMMEFQARLHGMRRADYKRRVPEVLDRVGIAERSRVLIGRLSRGQRQRVGLAVALLPDPEVLILDEPTSGLDPLQRLEIRTLLRELADEHTVLLSSHILPEVEAVCPRVIILNKGRMAADGTSAELVQQLGRSSHVRLEAVVGGDPAGAQKLLGQIRGVERVLDEGRLGIHHQFVLECEEDLREDVGALAAQKGWALRELSWHRPTLEELFSRIALELDPEHLVEAAPQHAPAKAAAPSAPSTGGSGTPLNVLSPGLSAGAASAPDAPRKVVYNLNPFDQGAGRDLSRPKAVDTTGDTSGGAPAEAGEECDRESSGDA